MRIKGIPGDWNVITDCCGMTRKFSQCVRQWDGLVVCPEHHDPRHPLDFVKSTHDDQRVPIARPQLSPENATYITGTVGTTSVLTNGTFAADTDWNKGTGWAIAGGTANCDGTQTDTSLLFQDGVLSPGAEYSVAFTMVGYTAGEICVRCGTVDGTERSANGTYTERIIVVGNPYSRFSFVASSDFKGNISSVTAYLVTY